MSEPATVVTQCKNPGCGETFSYERTGHRPREFCPKCLLSRQKECRQKSSKAHRDRIRMATSEVTGGRHPGKGNSSRAMSCVEVARRIALWEGFEKLLETGDSGVMKPLTAEAIRQIERKAVLKIRRAVGPEYRAYKSDLQK